MEFILEWGGEMELLLIEIITLQVISDFICRLTKDGRVLNKDGNEFMVADDVAEDIDEKLKVYSGEYADRISLFTIQQIQVDGTGTTTTI